MVRAPCREKMGLNKGPWTHEEDQILVSYIQKYGHGNWRALPKLAGLSRCGKSCRLRWMNYLRPDIKRGNFSREEEDMIINLHEMLGNRWSAIAARMQGRTDNEIKNVWHTHLKKRLTNPNHSERELPKRKARPPQSKAATNQTEPKPVRLQQNSVKYASNPTVVMQTSSIQSSFDNNISDIFSSSTSSSTAMETHDTGCCVTNDSMNTLLEELVELDQSFWNEALSMENCAASVPMDATAVQGNNKTFSLIDEQLNSENDEDINFWLRVFMEAGELNNLPEL